MQVDKKKGKKKDEKAHHTKDDINGGTDNKSSNHVTIEHYLITNFSDNIALNKPSMTSLPYNAHLAVDLAYSACGTLGLLNIIININFSTYIVYTMTSYHLMPLYIASMNWEMALPRSHVVVMLTSVAMV